MQCSGSLRTQLEDATATASQRPDSLEGFILWQAAMQSPASASGGQRASCMHGPVLAGSTGRGSFCGGDAVRVGLLAEVEALRTLLDVLRCATSTRGGGGGEKNALRLEAFQSAITPGTWHTGLPLFQRMPAGLMKARTVWYAVLCCVAGPAARLRAPAQTGCLPARWATAAAAAACRRGQGTSTRPGRL